MPEAPATIWTIEGGTELPDNAVDSIALLLIELAERRLADAELAEEDGDR